MINLASPPSQINSDVIKFNTDYGDPIDYEIEWHPYSEVWGGNLDPAMKLAGPPGIGIIAPPCADDSDLCNTMTTVSVTLERPAKQMHIQFGVSKGSSYEESPGSIGTFFHVQNQTTNVWDNVYTQWGLRTGGNWEVITLTPLHYNEDHTVNISFSVHNAQTGQVGSVIGSWQAVFFYEEFFPDINGDGYSDYDCNPDNVATATIVIDDIGGIVHWEKFTLVDSEGLSTVYTINGGIYPGDGGGSGGQATVGFGGIGGPGSVLQALFAIVTAINNTSDADYSAFSDGVDTVTIRQGSIGLSGNRGNNDSSISGLSVSDFTGACCNPDGRASVTLTLDYVPPIAPGYFLNGNTMIFTNYDGSSHTLTARRVFESTSSTIAVEGIVTIEDAINEMKIALDAAVSEGLLKMSVGPVVGVLGNDEARGITLIQDIPGTAGNTAVTGSYLSEGAEGGFEGGCSVSCNSDNLATSSLRFIDAPGPVEGGWITLRDTNGTSVTFEIDDAGDGPSDEMHVAVDRVELNGQEQIVSSMDSSSFASSLSHFVNNQDNLNITATDLGSGGIMLQQNAPGISGNTQITFSDNVEWNSVVDFSSETAPETIFFGGCDLTEWYQGSWDKDRDGYDLDNDDFPNNSYEWLDSDGDGVGDNSDSFPFVSFEWLDSDGDGVGDNTDTFPLNSTEWLDSDGDGVGDNTDAFPLDSTEWLDSDGDGVGDNTDAFPLDSTEWLDYDGDGVGDNADLFPLDPTEWIDSDSDGVGDNTDAFPDDPTRTFDNDGDGISIQEEGAYLDRLPQQYVVIVIAICLIIAQTSLWWITLWIRQERQ
ncbi:MAG: hypothetical protein CMD14_10270 [Flavobacteriales bacterium]|nr:hypothetical protein [Flavobacteriales bacterium]